MLEQLFLGFLLGCAVAYLILKDKLRKEEMNRSVLARQLSGTYIEKLVPFMKECQYDPKDMVFLGKPVDYIVFNRSDDDAVTDVIFLEIKTGNSQLSNREISLKKAIENKSISWRQIRL